jgi:putative Mn2+ efflux pump MntP
MTDFLKLIYVKYPFMDSYIAGTLLAVTVQFLDGPVKFAGLILTILLGVKCIYDIMNKHVENKTKRLEYKQKLDQNVEKNKTQDTRI